MWTRFMDMHSGGGSKEQYDEIYIEAAEDTAKLIFYNHFGHNPERVTCTCCGNDYSISEYETLEEATEYDRDHGYGEKRYHETLEQHVHRPEVLVIFAKDFKPEWLIGSIPRQGYVWVD